MATCRLRRFSCPETLRAIAPDRLAAFLRPFRDFLRGRGAPVPDPGLLIGPDCDRLVAAFMSPDRDTPKELLDALFFVDEMATREGMDALLDAARERGLGLGARADDSPRGTLFVTMRASPQRESNNIAFAMRCRPMTYTNSGLPKVGSGCNGSNPVPGTIVTPPDGSALQTGNRCVREFGHQNSGTEELTAGVTACGRRCGSP
jgi:hypothetical protein